MKRGLIVGGMLIILLVVVFLIVDTDQTPEDISEPYVHATFNGQLEENVYDYLNERTGNTIVNYASQYNENTDEQNQLYVSFASNDQLEQHVNELESLLEEHMSDQDLTYETVE
ncbi:hypothetical protein MM326_03745 [Alkalihalobacillus sp. LMS6]|uniref:hypothetical protein n=1 Tax=Alkalihalobacillus sp. LMS6 TaxID=2924034 RepID=UPI0020D1E89C|nr:hypothetical protein [Alkalihalobacillus sp. LMS6]UTR07158.1 hypothetical protein MM326_03745 [Alkalihalobacillus sp. LMS6]